MEKKNKKKKRLSILFFNLQNNWVGGNKKRKKTKSPRGNLIFFLLITNIFFICFFYFERNAHQRGKKRQKHFFFWKCPKFRSEESVNQEIKKKKKGLRSPFWCVYITFGTIVWQNCVHLMSFFASHCSFSIDWWMDARTKCQFSFVMRKPVFWGFANR